MGFNMNDTYKAFVAEYINETEVIRSVKVKNLDDLPANEVLIEVHYSSLNYKDSLSARGHKGITRKYPHTPGIDAAGIIADPGKSKLKQGMRVLVTG